MKTWVLSIIGTVILITIAELLLPSGKMKNITRSIFGVLIMIVVLKPLPSIRNRDWNLNYDLAINFKFLDRINERKVESMQSDGVKLLAELGYEDSRVTLAGEWSESKFVIKSVVAYASRPIESPAIEKLAQYYGVDTRAVVSNGSN